MRPKAAAGLREPVQSRWLTAGFALPFLSVCVLPIALLFVRAALGLLSLPGVGQTAALFNFPREALLFCKTVAYAVAVAVAVSLAGYLAAGYACGPGRKTWQRWVWLLAATLPVPASVHAMAWLKWAGLLGKLGLFPVYARGWGMSFVVQSFAMLPIAVLIIAGGMLTVNLDQIQAAQLLAPDHRFAFRILPRLLQPQILAALAITFMLTVNDYTIPSIFSVNTYAIEVFVEYSSSLSLTRTVLKSLPLTALQLGVLGLSLGLVSRVFLSGRSGAFAAARLRYPPAARALFSAGPLLVCAGFAAPLAIILLDAGMWQDLSLTAAQVSRDGLTSLGIALLAGVSSLPLSYCTARWAQRSTRPRLCLFLILLPAAIPSSLIGVALIHLFNHPATAFFYNGIGMPVLAALIRFLPFATLIVLAWLRRIDPALLAAGWILDRSALRTALRLVVPMATPALVLGSALVFLLGLGELPATVIAIPPGLSTVTIRLYNYLHYGATQGVLGLSFLMLCTIACGTGIIWLLAKGRSR